jgi:threonine dehydratase
MQPVTSQEFADARARMGAHVHHTPLVSSSTLSETERL